MEGWFCRGNESYSNDNSSGEELVLSMISYNMLLDRLQYMNKLNKSSSTHGKQDTVGVHLKMLIVLLGILKITYQHTFYQAL